MRRMVRAKLACALAVRTNDTGDTVELVIGQRRHERALWLVRVVTAPANSICRERVSPNLGVALRNSRPNRIEILSRLIKANTYPPLWPRARALSIFILFYSSDVVGNSSSQRNLFSFARSVFPTRKSSLGCSLYAVEICYGISTRMFI